MPHYTTDAHHLYEDGKMLCTGVISGLEYLAEKLNSLTSEINRLNDCSANCHQFHDSVNDCVKMTATRCAQICENYNQSDDRQLCADLIRKEFNLSD